MPVAPPTELAQRISRISVSATMKVAADADRLRREGHDVVDFSVGEPDFPTPANVKQAAIQAINDNFTKYTPAGGIAELKAAICKRHKTDYGTDYSPAECAVTVGGKFGIFAVVQALINEGDEVIVPVPYWVSFADIVNFAGGKTVFVDSSEADGFAVSAAAIEKGFFQDEIARSAYEFQQRVEGGETVIVGVNQFTDDSEGLSIPSPDYAGMERGQVARLAKARVARDAAAHGSALSAVGRAAASVQEGKAAAALMPLVIDAVRARASVGEISDTFAGAWGRYAPG